MKTKNLDLNTQITLIKAFNRRKTRIHFLKRYLPFQNLWDNLSNFFFLFCLKKSDFSCKTLGLQTETISILRFVSLLSKKGNRSNKTDVFTVGAPELLTLFQIQKICKVPKNLLKTPLACIQIPNNYGIFCFFYRLLYELTFRRQLGY